MPDLPARTVLWAILSAAIILRYANAQCPNSMWLHDSISQTCYWIGPNIYQTWIEANSYCQNTVGEPLAFVTSYQDWRFLHSILNGAFVYLGCTDNATEGAWICSDGLETPGIPWNRAEPNGGQGSNCLVMYPTSVMDDVPCNSNDQLRAPVCQKRLIPSLVPVTSPCRSGYTSVGNLCLITMGVYSYALAEQVCPCGTQLLTFLNQRDHRAFLASSYWLNVGSLSVWLGLSVDGDRRQMYHWKWTYDNERIFYNLWYSNEPDVNNAAKVCVVLEKSSSTWRSVLCNDTYTVVCIYDATKKDYSHVPAP